MTDAATRQLVEQVVQDRVQAGAMFTAYDITVEARKRGARVRHGEARDIVHQVFQRGGMGASYDRSVIDVGAAAKPFLYHRFSDDPANYRSSTGGASQQPGFLQRIVGKLLGSSQPAAPSTPSATAGPSAASGGPKPRRRAPETLGLDADQFLPVSREELQKASRGMQIWASPWFGRRDLIPPADDERTKLIDRALVTHGLLSPEQLVEIHSVGAEMDELRPDPLAVRHQAQRAGQAAVDEQREEKAKEKAAKKAAAAERREARRQEIARRRATDITFLGRGVSGRLGDRQSDANKLAANDLPLLSSPADVAAALGVSIGELRWLAYHTEVASRVHYLQFTVPKRSGGVRQLSAPHRKLAAAQNWILQNILAKLTTESPAHGFVRGRGTVSNAQCHVRREVVVNMDLQAFFPSITFPRVRSVFHRLGYSPAAATILALLCTECPRRQVEYDKEMFHVATGPRGLPQGACTSPALSNQVASRLDKRLAGIARKLAADYTRYADDLTFSGDQPLNDRIGYLMARVRHIAQDEGFSVNEKKSRVLRRNAAQSVTGLVVNDRVGAPRAEVRRVRAILHRARFDGLDAQNRDDHPDFRAWLRGKIAYIAMSRPEAGQQLKTKFEALLRRDEE